MYFNFLGILDSDIVEGPISHNFVGSKANWDDLDASLPRYDGFEPARQKAQLAYAKEYKF